MAFPIGKRDVGPALGAAIHRVAADKETFSTFGYTHGSPQKNPQFAYEREGPRALVKQYVDEMGGFGAVADNKKDKTAQRFLADTVAQMQGAQDAGIFQVV